MRPTRSSASCPPAWSRRSPPGEGTCASWSRRGVRRAGRARWPSVGREPAVLAVTPCAGCRDALDELVALVESARAVPLSASACCPRARAGRNGRAARGAAQGAQDAREVLVARQELLGQARDRRDRATGEARAEAERGCPPPPRGRPAAPPPGRRRRCWCPRMASGGPPRRRRAACWRRPGACGPAAGRRGAYADARLAALEVTLARLLGPVERGGSPPPPLRPGCRPAGPARGPATRDPVG